MRGPIEGVPGLLQPTAHALLQIKEDLRPTIEPLSEEQLWSRPGNVASIAFHVRHITGVIDRMFTYASGNILSDAQLRDLAQEEFRSNNSSKKALVDRAEAQIDTSVQILKSIDPISLTETRYLGRKKIPTTMIGLLFHAAEHSQRHFGQLLVTRQWILTNPDS